GRSARRWAGGTGRRERPALLSVAPATRVGGSAWAAANLSAGAEVSMSAMAGDGGASYKRAGVDLEAAQRSLDLITRDVEATYTPHVIRGLGAFGGLFEVPAGYRRPVLVASTDGVGTKVMVASAL